MLYNPNWDRADFVKWLGEQPANKEYDYYKPRSCAVAQYLKSTGEEDPTSFPDKERAFGVHGIVAMQPWTFGAAYARARSNFFQRAWWNLKARIAQ